MNNKRSLTCISCNNLYSLYKDETVNEYKLQVAELPIRQNDSENTSIKIGVPAYLQNDFSINEPLELKCLSPESSLTKSDCSMLCCYTSKSIFILELQNNKIIEINEPCDTILLNNVDASIVRVRSFLSISNLLYPKGSFVALLSNGVVIVHHSTRQACTIPIVFDQLVCVDFTLDSNLNLFVLSKDSKLYGCSPIVVDGMIVPTWWMEQHLSKCTSCEDNKEYLVRRARAEMEFLKLFQKQNSDFYECLFYNSDLSMTSWPLSMQGPLYSSDASTWPVCLELVKQMDDGSGVGFVISYQDSYLEWIHLSKPLSMRFGFESVEDSRLFSSTTALLERVQLEQTTSSNFLIVDEDMIHFVDSIGIFTITTNAMQLKETTTDAFSTLEISQSDISLVGATLLQTPEYGHVLIATLSNGSIEAVNLTATLYVKSFINQQIDSPPPKTKQNKMELPPPLMEQLQPLLDTIHNTRANLPLLSSSKLTPSQCDAATLATMLHYRKNWEKGYILPLSQMFKLVMTRIPLLMKLYATQEKSIDNLKNELKSLQSQMEESTKAIQTLETNAKSIQQRCSSLLQTTKECVPNITIAEKNYFDTIEKLYVQYKHKLEKDALDLTKRVNDLKSKEGSIMIQLEKAQIEMCHDLLAGQEVQLLNVLEEAFDIRKTLDEFTQKKDGTTKSPTFPPSV